MKPVAYCVTKDNHIECLCFNEGYAQKHANRIENAQVTPLYTHPVKEQDTDCQYCKQGCIRCDARKQLTDEEIAQEWGNFCPNVLEFARAILRKAQEK